MAVPGEGLHFVAVNGSAARFFPTLYCDLSDVYRRESTGCI